MTRWRISRHAFIVVAASIWSLVLRHHLCHVSAASGTNPMPVRSNGGLALGCAALPAVTVFSRVLLRRDYGLDDFLSLINNMTDFSDGEVKMVDLGTSI